MLTAEPGELVEQTNGSTLPMPTEMTEWQEAPVVEAVDAEFEFVA